MCWCSFVKKKMLIMCVCVCILSSTEWIGQTYCRIFWSSIQKRDKFRLRVVAADRGDPPLWAEVDVELDVVDRNNKPPLWDLTNYGPIFVKENVTVGTVVTSVKARSVFVFFKLAGYVDEEEMRTNVAWYPPTLSIPFSSEDMFLSNRFVFVSN